jgi:peroxiredoxin
MKHTIIMLCLLLLSIHIKAQDATTGYSVGNVAENFSLKNIDGKMMGLTDFPGAKGFIVIFTCNHCPFSVAYEDRIIALNQKYKHLGYPVIAINPNDPEIQPEDSYDNMKKRAKQKKFDFPYLLDEGAVYARKYGATKTPHVYVLNLNGSSPEVAYIGAIDDNSRNAGDVKVKYLENAVDELIAGKQVSVSTTKAIGCSIKFPRKTE